MKKAIVSVIGQDKVGIIAKVSACLADCGVNILDISQTVMQEYFTMMMLTDVSNMVITIGELTNKLNAIGDEMHLTIRVNNEDIFNAMHRL